MTETQRFALTVLVVSGAGLAAVWASRPAAALRIPLPGVVLVAAAAVANAGPGLHPLGEKGLTRVVSLALVAILFAGGLHIGWRRFQASAVLIIALGVVGTAGTAVGGALVLRGGFGLAWYPAVLVATAIAPTDPAVVFSVLGSRQVAGRSATVLEGESGANDPVGIALIAGLIGAGTLNGSGAAHVAGGFALQMAVGIAVGGFGGRALLFMMRRGPLPGEGLYPLQTLAAAFLLYGVATVAHGSGFLAAFVAGIVLGDETAPYKAEIERFHGALASLGEIVAFAVLGLSVDLSTLARADVWIPGLVLGVALVVAVRPTVVGPLLRPARLSRAEKRFVMAAGLKGAVPILLGSSLLGVRGADGPRLYGIVVVVVAVSVLGPAGLIGAIARRLGLPMASVEPEPWAVGVRLGVEPRHTHQMIVGAGSPADGATVAELGRKVPDMWLTLLLRDGELLPVRGATRLRAGDRLTVLADPQRAGDLAGVFDGRPPPGIRSPEPPRRGRRDR